MMPIDSQCGRQSLHGIDSVVAIAPPGPEDLGHPGSRVNGHASLRGGMDGCGRLVRFGAVLVLACVVTGCGYSADPLYRKNIRTVYVEMFHSKEFRRDIEFHLTEAVRKQIDRMTPYRNAPRARADSILTGEVLEWREATLGHDPLTALPRETAGTLAIRYRWQDLRTGALLVDQPQLITTVPYVRPTSETVHNALDDAVNRMARKVVHGMETAW